ncbi:hypothetical protein ACVGWN_11065, partial [Enterobacter hormaechei]
AGEQSAKADAGRDGAYSVAGAGVNNAGWGVGFPADKKMQFMARKRPAPRQKNHPVSYKQNNLPPKQQNCLYRWWAEE